MSARKVAIANSQLLYTNRLMQLAIISFAAAGENTFDAY